MFYDMLKCLYSESVFNTLNIVKKIFFFRFRFRKTEVYIFVQQNAWNL